MLVAGPLTVTNFKKMWIVPLSFLCLIFSNAKSLQYTNVETVIAFRTLTTFAVAYGDFKLSGIQFSMGALGGLAMIVVGALGYMYNDSEFKVLGYFWVSVYTLVMVVEPLLVKSVINTVNMTNWGRSYYNNATIALPLLVIAVSTGESVDFPNITQQGWIIVAVSCVVGTGISFVGFLFRASVDATSYAVTGNVNKIATITVNLLIWDSHASALGIVFLLVALAGGVLYGKAKISN